MSKDVTNDELARMIATGFGEMDNRFKEVNKKLDQHSRDISDLNFKVSEMVHKSDYYLLEERVRNVETKLKIA